MMIKLDPERGVQHPEVLRTIARYLDLESTRRLAARMARQQIWNCPTAVVWQGTSLPESEAMSRPWLRYEPQALINSWNPANDFRFRDAPYTRDEYVAAARERNEMLLQVIGIMHQEGAPLLLGTDTPNPFTFQGFSLHDELDNLIRAGLTPYEALACGTPVLTCPSGAAPEVVEDGVTGYVRAYDDELVEAVHRVGALDRTTCRRQAEERFDTAHMAENYLRVYDHVRTSGEQPV